MKKFFFYFLALFFFFAVLFQALWLMQVDFDRLTSYGMGFIAGKIIVMGVTGYLLYYFIRRLRQSR
jgi:hypothetical protein